MGEWAEDEIAAEENRALDRAMGWDHEQGSECPKCKGSGKEKGNRMVICLMCDGDGEI